MQENFLHDTPLMNQLHTAAKYLAERGLTVEVISSTQLSVRRQGDRSLDISQSETGYTVSSWECTPGPGDDDFIVTLRTLEEALLVAWNYCFAQSIEISGWKVPLHRRPDWSLPKLQYRLANAALVSTAQLDVVRDTRRRRALADPAQREVGLALAERTQFLLAGVHAGSGDKLYLRRDMEEAYVVKNEG
ncbi:MAG: hypothetical protein RLZZ618_2830 [Pseudomonadota bacterium]|jgi:hypothetical protein